jgi:RimJ/RimL family protein N-acetyltransferase
VATEGRVTTDAVRLVTPTCVLRPLVPADAPTLARHADDRAVASQLRDRFPSPYTLDDAEWYVAHVAERTAATGRVTSFAIDVGGEAVGGISLVPGTDIERVGAEIGYWLGRAHWGRGIVSHAVVALTAHALGALGYLRLFAVPFADNVASCRVLERAGYALEGTMRASAIKDGVVRDQRLYAAVHDTWRPHASPPASG